MVAMICMESFSSPSVAIGAQAVADADLSTALGTKSKANAFGSVAFGVGDVYKRQPLSCVKVQVLITMA